MKRLLILAGGLGVAACGGEATPEGQDAAPVETAAPVMAADGAPPQGRYRAVSETGSILIEELREDGTYTFTDDEGNLLEEGAYVQETPARLCFTANTEGAARMCFAEEIGEDGIWRTIDPNTGEVSVVERIDAE